MNRTAQRKAQRKLGQPWKLLEDRLLAIGGEQVDLAPGYREFLDGLGEEGVRSLLDTMTEFSTAGATTVCGWPGSCTFNTLPRWLNGEGDLVAGFALRGGDRVWWANDWIQRPDGTALDSLPGHVAYFGAISNDPSTWSPTWHELLELHQLANTSEWKLGITLVPSGGE